MKKYIYIVVGEFDYNCENILGVFTSNEDAIKLCSEFKKHELYEKARVDMVLLNQELHFLDSDNCWEYKEDAILPTFEVYDRTGYEKE